MILARRLLRYFLWVMLTFLLLLLSAYWYLKLSLNEIVSQEDLKELIVQIKSSEDLPKRFYELYEREYSNSLIYDSKRRLIANLLRGESYKCPSHKLSFMTLIRWKEDMDVRRAFYLSHPLAWQIEERTTQKECLNWICQNFDFTSNNVGVKQASEYYFSKPIQQLNDEELTGIIVIMKNPALYNPIRHKDTFDLEVKAILNK